MVFPVNRCGPEGKVEEGTVEDFFDFAPLPSLRNECGFLWLSPYCRRGVGRKRPRGVGEAYERLPEHIGSRKGTEPSEISIPVVICLSAMSQSTGSPLLGNAWVTHVLQKNVGKMCIYAKTENSDLKNSSSS